MDATVIEVRDEASASLVRAEVRRTGVEVGLAPERVELLAAAASELAFNQLDHARLGDIGIEAIRRGVHRGIQLTARDRGGGVPDLPAAIAGRLTGAGLGVGLAAVRRAVDELDGDVRHLEGSSLVVRAFAEPAPRHPEVVIEGRPLPGEGISGDDACLVRTGRGFLAAVVDGLGHGPGARQASRLAVEVVAENASLPLPEIIERAHQALVGTRGAALSVARFDRGHATVEVCGVGNIDTLVLDPSGDAFSHAPRAGTVGIRRLGPAPVCRFPMLTGSMLLMCTDGMPRRARMAAIPGLARHPPVWVAHHLLMEHARANDDALVLVAR